MSDLGSSDTEDDSGRHWLCMANESLASARLERGAGHLTFAVNRAYYACFYAARALLATEGKDFSKHTAVLSEFHRRFVKERRVQGEMGKRFQRLFSDRQMGDYVLHTVFTRDDIDHRIVWAEEFVCTVTDLLQQ